MDEDIVWSAKIIHLYEIAEIGRNDLSFAIVIVGKSNKMFARLGYTLDEATSLADSANLYKNVGDGITDINEASQSIISTMKAFNIEADDSISIVDKFNEVGKTIAPDLLYRLKAVGG